ncbi:sugar MFS transporter [Fulvivirga sediminis]|uniref:Sugar MFS transporter n=1 Tax=Fulvivirga sediminis TaxID=2803949 RepID=A0A937F6E8_9BACT|nr:sugar MFS transporter [Fulvivirga sediminis]MBL3655876.1 sugar MFS transporter [Fulvivirga sediminis]
MSKSKGNFFMSMCIIGTLFFTIGFATWVNGTLIPYLQIACQLETEIQAYLVATAFYIAYTLMALPSSYVLGKVGYKKGMSLSLFVMAIGAIIFVPAATVRSFNLFLVGLFIIGTGLALLQTAVNPYVSIIGPSESAATRMSIMGISNKIAGILAGLIFGYITLSDVDALEASLASMNALEKAATLDELASRVIIPYYIIAAVLAVLAVVIWMSSLPEIQGEEDEEVPDNSGDTSRSSILQFPHLLLGVLALFLYVGVEVVAGDTIIGYGKSLDISLSVARYFTQITLACMLLGYVIGIFAIPKYISQAKALAVCAILGLIFSVGALVTTGYVSVACIALLGLANSLMWPAIFPLAIHNLGKFTARGSALLVMAISGGAILPLIYGTLSDMYNGQLAYLVLLPCYAYICFFAVKGHKIGLK